MKSFKATIIISVLCFIGLYSCDSNTHQNNSNTIDEEIENALPFGVNDTIEGEKVSNDCALLNHEFEYLQRRVENVKSPDMLMRVKKDFNHILDSLTSCSELLSQEEKSTINEIRATILASYGQACKNYEIPADGVISNLTSCIDQLNEAHSRQEIVRFTECRRGTIRDLDYIHLCVESKSTKINEVKRLAAILKEEVNREAKRYNIKL